jgi:hypothetical protein
MLAVGIVFESSVLPPSVSPTNATRLTAQLSNSTGGDDDDEKAAWSAGELDENNKVMNPIVASPFWYPTLMLSSSSTIAAATVDDDDAEFDIFCWSIIPDVIADDEETSVVGF